MSTCEYTKKLQNLSHLNKINSQAEGNHCSLEPFVQFHAVSWQTCRQLNNAGSLIYSRMNVISVASSTTLLLLQIICKLFHNKCDLTTQINKLFSLVPHEAALLWTIQIRWSVSKRANCCSVFLTIVHLKERVGKNYVVHPLHFGVCLKLRIDIEEYLKSLTS